MSDPLTKLASQIPIIGGLFDDSQDQALQQLKKNQELYGNLQTPDFQKYVPDAYKVAGEYDPEKAQAQTVSEDPSLRSTQLAVLNKMAGLADTGLSDVDQAGYEHAREIGDQMVNSGTQAALQNAAARGQAGSGMEFAMREAANQAGAGRAQDAGLQQSADSARMRAMYAQMMGQDASSLRSQDFSNNAANAGIMNQFNLLNTQNANQAQQYNLGNKQNVSNMNVQNQNAAQQYNNQMTQQQYQDQLQKVSGQTGANSGMAQGYAAENAANTAARNQNTQLATQAVMGGMGGGSSAKDLAALPDGEVDLNKYQY